MLKANAIGRLQGFEDFKEALNYVALTYPNNPEGKKAEQMVAEQLPKLEVKEFSKETQFLVITHRKGTMEFVDTLYGTTMEEQGVTKLVSMKLSNYNM